MALGDSRDNARDSRYLGMIPYANIVGVVVNFQPATLAR
jgi:type IV secretory pathway protease TraF